MSKVEKKRLNLSLPVPLYDSIKKESDKRGCTVTQQSIDWLRLGEGVTHAKRGERRFKHSPDVGEKEISEMPF